MLNKNGYDLINTILEKSLIPLSFEQITEKLENKGEDKIVLLDTRDVAEVCNGFIPGSIAISLKTNYATWAATLFTPHTKIILITEIGKEKESIVRLARVGLENIIGYLDGGFASYISKDLKIEKLNNIMVSVEVVEGLKSNNKTIIDCREKGEWESSGIIEGSIPCQLSQLENNLGKIPVTGELYLLCRSGQRSVISATILKSLGFENDMTNLAGGAGKLMESNYKFSTYSL